MLKELIEKTPYVSIYSNKLEPVVGNKDFSEYINYFKNNTKNDEDVILYRKRNKYKRKLVNLYNEFITKYNVKKCKHRTHTLIDIMLKNEKTKNDDRLLKLVKKFKSIESDIRILSKKNGYGQFKAF